MPSLLYDSFDYDSRTGAIVLPGDTFKMMLVDSTYTPLKGAHSKRSDVTGEVSGAGYSAGGVAITPSLVLDTINHLLNITWSQVSWLTVTLTNVRAGVIYKSRGGLASADELVGYVDFGSVYAVTGGSLYATIILPQQDRNY